MASEIMYVYVHVYIYIYIYIYIQKTNIFIPLLMFLVMMP
jgi:hypothetical protein